jgi:hypothetical protein
MTAPMLHGLLNIILIFLFLGHAVAYGYFLVFQPLKAFEVDDRIQGNQGGAQRLPAGRPSQKPVRVL